MRLIYEPTSLTLRLLRQCTTTTTLKTARKLHALLLTSTTTRHPTLIHNHLLSMYPKCASLIDAHKVLDEMPQRNIISYNSLISSYANDSQFSAKFSFNLFAQMRFEGFRPNGSTFTSLFQAGSSLWDWFTGLALHCLGLKYGVLIDVYVQTALIGMYSKFGDLGSAENLFRSIVVKDAIAWNCVISGYLKNNRIRDAFCLFSSMVGSGVVPTEFTYSMILNACGRTRDYNFGRLAHSQAIVTNVPVDLALQNALLDMYSSCGDVESASRIFVGIEDPDLVSWNSMMAGYSENRDGERAMDLFVQLQRRSDVSPDEYTFAAVISAVQEFEASDFGEPLHGQVIRSGCDKSVYVGSPLISMYFSSGRIESAEQVFHSIPKKDIVLWTEMISGYSRMSDGENAIKFFKVMYQEGHKNDSFSLSSALSSCADLASLKQGEMIHSQAIKTGYDSKMTVCGSLIDLYAKNGDLKSAESIFFKVTNPDLKCWNAMIGGYGLHGMEEEALKLYDNIISYGLKPDQVTFISLLSACSHRGSFQTGKYLWSYMKEIGLNPGPKHYSCMVSLLTRAGLLEEAAEMINESPYSENRLELWRNLLSSSVANKNLGMGLKAAGKVFKLNVEDGATHTLLSNLYAALGRWDGVMETRRRVRGLMLEKEPGLSWVESRNGFDVFSSSDQLHSRIDEVKVELQGLHGNMVMCLAIDDV